MRSELMDKIAALIDANGWTQAEAANYFGIAQPRINELLRGRISRFSMGALENITAASGQRLHVKFEVV